MGDTKVEFVWGPLDGRVEKVGERVGRMVQLVSERLDGEGRRLFHVYERMQQLRGGEPQGHVLHYAGMGWLHRHEVGQEVNEEH